MLLKDKIFGRDIVFVGDDSGLQRELLRRLERVGGGDQVGGETAGEEVARRAGGERRTGRSRDENRFLPHEFRRCQTRRAAPGGQPRAAVPT